MTVILPASSLSFLARRLFRTMTIPTMIPTRTNNTMITTDKTELFLLLLSLSSVSPRELASATAVIVVVVVAFGHTPRRSLISPSDVERPDSHLLFERDQPHSSSHCNAHLMTKHLSGVVVVSVVVDVVLVVVDDTVDVVIVMDVVVVVVEMVVVVDETVVVVAETDVVVVDDTVVVVIDVDVAVVVDEIDVVVALTVVVVVAVLVVVVMVVEVAVALVVVRVVVVVATPQSSPCHPNPHAHECEFVPSVQAPPFLHGFGSHSLTSV